MTLNHTPVTHNRRRQREERAPPFEWENRPPPHRGCIIQTSQPFHMQQNYLLVSIMRNQKRERTHADMEMLEDLEVARGWFVSRIKCSTFTPSTLCDELFTDKITASWLSLVCRLNGAADTLKAFFFSGHYYSLELESLWMLWWVQMSYY